jgi:hypothetical protein
LGDIHVNEDGSKTMNEKDQKIIHRWDYGRYPNLDTDQISVINFEYRLAFWLLCAPLE